MAELASGGSALLRNALQYVFSPEDEQEAVAAVAARLLDERAVCHVVGPRRTVDCVPPPYPNGMVGIAWNSPRDCAHCDSTINAADLPAEGVAILDAMHARGEELGPGDTLAFLCGPVVPRTSSSRVLLLAPSYDDATAAYVDRSFQSRGVTPTADMANRGANAPFSRDATNCRTGPQCWIYGPDTRCVCD